MAKRKFLPFYEKVAVRRTLGRASDLTLLFLLVSLVVYRLLRLTKYFSGDHNKISVFAWSLALLYESWFTFNWFLTVNIKWNPMKCITYPSRLLQSELELPPVDMFVTTADSTLEPPIMTVNTVLSLLAVDYPAEKLACYVSDDGCSPLTYYSLVEAFKFAKFWVPFCKKHDIQVRAPSRYFSGDSVAFGSLEFQEDWKMIKEKYEELSQKIEAASQKSIPCELVGEYSAFSNVKRTNHPPIIKIIWENKEGDLDRMPHLVYISREKRPDHQHSYKAGAMNVLTRVSGLMTNAPFMLNVDCDMNVNNPQVVIHAMCILLGSNNDKEVGFVQFPQNFHDALKDDPFGNQLQVLTEYMSKGLEGIQGMIYCGSGCFHRRKVIYGSWPNKDKQNGEITRSSSSTDGKVDDKELLTKFGSSNELIKSARDALNEVITYSFDLSSSIEAAYQVASSSYESATSWGSETGWMYGSTAEDMNTSIKIHSQGWCSVFYIPEPAAFLGCAPSSGPVSMIQQKRWATGLLEIVFTKNNPILLVLTAKLRLRQCLAYLWILIAWAASSIPELGYSLLPAYCIITNSTFLPKVDELAMIIPISIFLLYNLYSLWEYLQIGLSIRCWWNNQRMARIANFSAWIFGALSVVLKLLKISETVFEVTQKEQSSDGDLDDDISRFTFNESPAFVPGTTILLIQLTALVMVLLRWQPRPPASNGQGSGLGEVLSSLWLVLYLVPFLKGLFRKGKYGIPLSILQAAITRMPLAGVQREVGKIKLFEEYFSILKSINRKCNLKHVLLEGLCSLP
ncbi:hypothetical protein ACFE04_030306 [Oxalis oulophora]